MNILDIIHNKDKRYTGDLVHYYGLLQNCPNKDLLYHNIPHIEDVIREVYDACIFYNLDQLLTRILLIAALFHDWDHTGSTRDDALNIARAIDGLHIHLLDHDRPYEEHIGKLIYCTQYPYKDIQHSLARDIIRDADLFQPWDARWIERIIHGLSHEMGISPHAMLEMQVSFLTGLKFNTQWAEKRYGQHIDDRLTEVKKMIESGKMLV